MHAGDHVGPRRDQHLVAALELGTAEVVGCQAQLLDIRTERAVVDDGTLVHEVEEAAHRNLAGYRPGLGGPRTGLRCSVHPCRVMSRLGGVASCAMTARDPASTLRGCGGRGRGGSCGLRGRRRQQQRQQRHDRSNDNGTGSVVQSAQQLCDNLESLDSTVQDIEAIEETTVSDVKDGLASCAPRCRTSPARARPGRHPRGALQSAFDQFESTVEDLLTTRPWRPRAARPGRPRTSSSSRGARPWTRSTASGPPAPEHRVSSALGDAGRRSVGVWLSAGPLPSKPWTRSPGVAPGGKPPGSHPIPPFAGDARGTERGGTVAVMDEGEQAELERG